MGRAFCKRLYKSQREIRRVLIELLACSLVNDRGPWLLELPRTWRLAISNWPYQIQFSISILSFLDFFFFFFFHFSSLNYSFSSRQLLHLLPQGTGVKLVEAEEEDRGSKTLELFTLLLGGIGKNSRVGCRCKRGERERESITI
jgi:hypothetical protein